MDPNEAIEIIYSNNNNNYYKKKKRIKVQQQETGGQRVWERERQFLFYIFFVSFSDLQKSDRKFSSKQKAKFVYATRAMRRYQKLSISVNSKR